MAKKKTTKKKTTKKKATKKQATKKKASKKQATKKKSTKKKTASKKVNSLEEAKTELRDSVKNAVQAFAHIANAAEKEAIDGLISVAPESTETHKQLVKRKKTLEKGDTQSIASDILTQIRGALKSHKIDFGASSPKPPKSRKTKAD